MQQRRALLKERAQLREQLHALHPQQCTTLTSGIREDWPHGWLPQNPRASLNAPLALTNAGYTGWEQGMRTLHTTEAPAVSPPQPHSTLPPQLLHHGQICNTAETGQLRSSDQNNTQDFDQHGPQGSQNKPRGTPKEGQRSTQKFVHLKTHNCLEGGRINGPQNEPRSNMPNQG